MRWRWTGTADDRGWKALHRAVLTIRDAVVLDALLAVSDANARNADGMTPLMLSVQNTRPGDVDGDVRMLAGVTDLLGRDVRGRTVADLARDRGMGDLAEWFEGLGAARGEEDGLDGSLEGGGCGEGDRGGRAAKPASL